MNLSHRREWLLRGLVLASAAGALAGIRMPRLGAPKPPIAVVDVSASLGRTRPTPPSQGRLASVWLAVGGAVQEVEGVSEAPTVPRDQTRPGAALRHARARFPGRDLWLVTDGRSTGGDVEAAARAVQVAGGRVFVSPPPSPPADVALAWARMFRAGGGRADVVASLESSTTGQARVLLMREGRIVAETEVPLDPGLRRTIRLQDPKPADAGGAYTVQLEVDRGTPNDDLENDRLVLGLPPEQPGVWVWGDLDVRPWALPDTPFVVRRTEGWEEGVLKSVDLVVLAGVPWRRIGASRVADLSTFVAGGGRLLLLGGPGAWAGGGWAGTPLEDRLSPLRTPRPEGPGLALLLVLDRSGSTAGGALRHLVRAAREAAASQGPGEHFAVLPFAATPDDRLLAPGWVGAGDDTELSILAQSLRDVLPGGGTDIPAAVLAAAERVARHPARKHRVLLLTDGDPDQAPDPETLRLVHQRLRALDVTFGALVSGMPEAARRLGEFLAEQPEDVVLLDEAAAIPDALLHEIGRRRSSEERLPPPQDLARLEQPPLLPALPSPLAWVHDLEVVPASAASVLALARWDRPERIERPFAASRVWGAGRVVALAWGPGGEPAARHAVAMGWLGALVEDLASEADRGLRADLDGDRLVVRAPALAGRGAANAIGTGGTSVLVETARERFEGPLPPGSESGLRLEVPDAGPDGEPMQRALHLPARPPAEHRGAGVDEAALVAIAAAGGGRRLAVGEAPPPRRSGPGAPLAPWLLLLACTLLVWERASPEQGPPFARSKGAEEDA